MTVDRSQQREYLTQKDSGEPVLAQMLDLAIADLSKSRADVRACGASAEAGTQDDPPASDGGTNKEHGECESGATGSAAGEALPAQMLENHGEMLVDGCVEDSATVGQSEQQCEVALVDASSAVSPESAEKLARARALREQVNAALDVMRTGKSPARINLTDADVGLVQGRQGPIVGYNAQAGVVALNTDVAGRSGRIITASDVTDEADDHSQPVPMLEQAKDTVGQNAETNLFDGGYHSGANLEACAEGGYNVLMAEAQSRALQNPYHKDRFIYNPLEDTFTCPEGHTLSLRGTKRLEKGAIESTYGSTKAVCLACPAFGKCTKDREGRRIAIGPHEEILRAHRNLMATDEAKAKYRQRKELPEPVFGTMKEEQGSRRFLLRGLKNVRSEWLLLSTAFNLRTLWRVWLLRPLAERQEFCTGVG